MTVLVTGAASGIGRALSEKLLAEGHTVYALDIVERAPKDNLYPIKADITSEADLILARDTLEKSGITLDSLICVAGIHRMASLVETDPDTLKRVIDVNLVGAMLTCRILHPLLSEKGRVVIVTSEVASFDPLPFNGLYNVSKSALDAYAQALRQELGLIGQTVVTVRPGAVETPLETTGCAVARRTYQPPRPRKP